jgi:putative endonuclease
MKKAFFVYMMTNKKNGTIYTGMTSNLSKRIWEHKNEVADSFTKEYGLKTLVWYEAHDTAESAIKREKNIKEWQRDWKIKRIVEINPEWNDLYEQICR